MRIRDPLSAVLEPGEFENMEAVQKMLEKFEKSARPPDPGGGNR